MTTAALSILAVAVPVVIWIVDRLRRKVLVRTAKTMTLDPLVDVPTNGLDQGALRIARLRLNSRSDHDQTVTLTEKSHVLWPRRLVVMGAPPVVVPGRSHALIPVGIHQRSKSVEWRASRALVRFRAETEDGRGVRGWRRVPLEASVYRNV